MLKKKTICKIIMPSEDIKISEFSQYKNLTKFCEFLRKHAMKIINFHKKKMKLLIKEQKSVIFIKKN